MPDKETTQDELFDEFLKDVNVGEEITDPRVGTHPDAVLSEVEVRENKSGNPMLVMTYSGCTDSDDNEFELKDFINLPHAETHPVGQRIFLGMLHDMGVVPRTHKRAILIESMDQAEKLAARLDKCVGINFPLRVTEDNQGYMRIRLQRQRR